MNPTLAQLLASIPAPLNTPFPPEAAGAFAASRNGMVATLMVLAAQEAESGVAVRVWENQAIFDLLQAAATRYPATMPPPAETPPNLTLSQLDAVNANLRRQLIVLHIAVEAAGDKPTDHEVLQLYREMARMRRLTMPGAG